MSSPPIVTQFLMDDWDVEIHRETNTTRNKMAMVLCQVLNSNAICKHILLPPLFFRLFTRISKKTGVCMFEIIFAGVRLLKFYTAIYSLKRFSNFGQCVLMILFETAVNSWELIQLHVMRKGGRQTNCEDVWKCWLECSHNNDGWNKINFY